MTRSELDQVARDYRLSESAVALALDVTGARPDAEAWRALARRVLSGAGVASLAAGAIFFVAANWQAYGVAGRFAILEAALLVCGGVALGRPPPAAPGQGALMLATLLSGALLALFGQTYQTGADLFELFFLWALVSLPFALAARSGAEWALWWCVVNAGLALYSGWLDPNHIVWSWLGGAGLERAFMLFVGCIVNLAAAGSFAALGQTRLAEHAPNWLVRMLLTFGFAFGTAACIVAVLHGSWLAHPSGRAQDAGVVMAFAVLCAVIAAATLVRWRDVFAMALIAASWIAISTAWMVPRVGKDAGTFFALAMWVIATSAGSAYVLMHWVRAWRAVDDRGASE